MFISVKDSSLCPLGNSLPPCPHTHLAFIRMSETKDKISGAQKAGRDDDNFKSLKAKPLGKGFQKQFTHSSIHSLIHLFNRYSCACYMLIPGQGYPSKVYIYMVHSHEGLCPFGVVPEQWPDKGNRRSTSANSCLTQTAKVCSYRVALVHGARVKPTTGF